MVFGFATHHAASSCIVVGQMRQRILCKYGVGHRSRLREWTHTIGDSLVCVSAHASVPKIYVFIARHVIELLLSLTTVVTINGV